MRAGHRCIAIGLAVVGSFLGCYTGPSVSDSRGLSVNAQSPTPGSAPEAGAAAGLPCDVAALLATRCGSCHSDPPGGGAPMGLVTYAQLLAPSVGDPTRTVAQVALARMRDTSRPMPPANVLPETDVAPFASWLEAGAPALGCVAEDAPTASHDAGPECVLASDCPGELVCRDGFCDVECVKDKDCVATWTCKHTRCQPPSIGGSASHDGTDAGRADAGLTTVHDFGSSLSWSTAEVSAVATGSYNGTAFDGRYVYFAPDGTNGKVLRFDTEQAFGSSTAWSAFDLTALDPRATGYRGAVFDGRYVYLVPAVGAGVLAARFDTEAPFASGASWSLFSLKTVSNALSGFTGATFDGRYLYLVPAFSPTALATRFDTHATFASAASWSTFAMSGIHPKATSFAGAAFDGRYVYYVPWRSGTTGGTILTRYDPQGGFGDPGSWTALDLTTLDANARGYHAAAFDGRYLYLVPGWTAPAPAWSSTTLARYDTKADLAASSSWSFFDMSTLGPEAGGFNAASFDGRYVVFAPGYASSQYRGDAFRLDTKGALTAAGSWSRFDATALASPLVNLKGTAFDGRYVYFAPSGGVVARFDAKAPRSMPELPGFHGSFY